MSNYAKQISIDRLLGYDLLRARRILNWALATSVAALRVTPGLLTAGGRRTGRPPATHLLSMHQPLRPPLGVILRLRSFAAAICLPAAENTEPKPPNHEDLNSRKGT